MDIDLLESNTATDINDALTQAINKAWPDAEGLMGGENPHIHIKEIASRLCQIIPNNPDVQNEEVQMDINLPDIDNLVKETTYKPTKITSIWQHLPTNSTKEVADTHINDIDLTKAYLRLAAQTS